jgi:hypothetical protein
LDAVDFRNTLSTLGLTGMSCKGFEEDAYGAALVPLPILGSLSVGEREWIGWSYMCLAIAALIALGFYFYPSTH